MAYVFDKALYRAQHPAALKGRPKSWKRSGVSQTRGKAATLPPPDEPVTGMTEVPKEILEWEYAAALESASKRATEDAGIRPS